MGACTATGTGGVPGEAPIVASQMEASPAPSAAGQSTPSLSTFTSPAMAVALMVPPASSLPPADMSVPAPSLLGLSSDEVSVLLGKPRYERREAPARIWQYADGRCVLDIFLYPDKNDLRVVYAESRDPRSLSAMAMAPCLSGLATSRTAGFGKS
ncbi:MAG: hypothetical protein KJ904_04165 [Alphaproteobacteria bacterium]|nr:hypothetical protein [Alphaproteobacteria bacterium]